MKEKIFTDTLPVVKVAKNMRAYVEKKAKNKMSIGEAIRVIIREKMESEGVQQ